MEKMLWLVPLLVATVGLVLLLRKHVKTKHGD